MASLVTLPREVLLTIGKQLPIKCLGAFSSTCKSIRKVISPILLEYIRFYDYDSSTALRCLERLSPEGLAQVSNLVIHLQDVDTSPGENPTIGHGAWTHLLQSLPSLREIVFHIDTRQGKVVSYLNAPRFVRLITETIPQFAKMRSQVSVRLIVRCDSAQDCSMPASGLDLILKTFQHLPVKFRIVLLCTGLEWDDDESTVDPDNLVNTIATSNFDLYQTREPLLSESYPSIPALCTTRSSRHLNLSGLDLTLDRVADLLKHTGSRLQHLSLSLAKLEPDHSFGECDLPNLASLRISSQRPANRWDSQEEDRMPSLRAIELFFKSTTVPSLSACQLDLPAWRVSKSFEIRERLLSCTGLRQLHLQYSSLGESKDEEHLEETQSLAEYLQERGIRTTLEVVATSVRPSDPTLGSNFEAWLLWYPSLRSYIIKLDLTFGSKSPHNEFPADLTLQNRLQFPNLKELTLRCHFMSRSFFQASRVCNKFDTPGLRHLKLDVSREGAQPFMYAVLATVPDYSSLVTFKLAAPGKWIDDLQWTWEEMCTDLNLAHGFDC